MQTSPLFENVGLMMGLMMISLILLMTFYIKTYARIYHPGVHYRHYRKGHLIREGHGGMVIRLPFLDRIEIVGVDPQYASDFTLSPSAKSIKKAVLVDAPIQDVWDAWTTHEGVTSFFAPDAKIGLYIGGPYEMYFDPDAPDGSRGGEGLRILSYLPTEMLSFEWNAPPSFPTERNVRTWVVILLKEMQQGQTEVTLTHFGWREELRWNEVYDYFEQAWDIVLARLQRRFIEGPINWDSLQTEN